MSEGWKWKVTSTVEAIARQRERPLVWGQKPRRPEVGDMVRGEKNNAPWQNSTLPTRPMISAQSGVMRSASSTCDTNCHPGGTSTTSHLLKNSLSHIKVPIKFIRFPLVDVSVRVRWLPFKRFIVTHSIKENSPFASRSYQVASHYSCSLESLHNIRMT